MDQNSDEVEEPGDTAMTSTVSEVKEDEKEEIIIPRLEDLPSYSVDDFGFLNNSDTKSVSMLTFTSQTYTYRSNNIRVIHSVKQYRQLESQWVAILNNWDEYRNNNFDRVRVVFVQ